MSEITTCSINAVFITNVGENFQLSQRITKERRTSRFVGNFLPHTNGTRDRKAMFFQFRDNILSNAVSAELVIAIDPNDIVFGLLFYADATFKQNLCEFRERIPFLTQSPVLLVEFSLLPCC